MSARRSILGAGVAGAIVVLLSGCAASPPSEAHRPPPRDVAEFLLALPPAAHELHRRLLSGEAAATLRPEIESFASLDGARDLLLAQLAFRDGQLASAERHLGGLYADTAASQPAALLRARLWDLRGDPVAAYLAYEDLAVDVDVASRRRDALRGEAQAALLEASERALAEGRLAAAAKAVGHLERLAPASDSTLELVVRVANGEGDRRRELAAIRGLLATKDGRLELELRRGELEVEVGDAAGGLALLEALADSHPQDGRARAALDRARFTYRLSNLPEAVREVMTRPVLSRADLARMLYWLAPQVRALRPEATRIATDVLDHPAREEIVRVVNLGLMTIDEAVHRFDPDRAVTRGETFAALARLAPSARRGSGACDFAARNGWISELGECLAAAPVAGREVLAWVGQMIVAPGDESGVVR